MFPEYILKTIPAIFAEQPEDGYGAPEVQLASDGRDIFVTSDLHLAAGRTPDGRFRGTENFFADEAYARFLTYAKTVATKKPILIINGDFIDFLRIKETPETDAEFGIWSNELRAIGIAKSVRELKEAVSPKEVRYGLKTNDYKSIWKLYLVSIGHRKVFAGLAKWIADGHTLILTKGNHDLEWIYPNVRRYFAYNLAQFIAGDSGKPIEDILPAVLQQLLFIDDTVVFDKVCYIEHGHRYDKFSHVVGDALFANGELNIPFGSFFNRYLINKIELVYPYLDNIKPAENLLPLLIRERFPLALKVLFMHIPFMFQMIKKRYFMYMFRDVLIYFITIGVPLGFSIYIIYKSIVAPHVALPDEMNPILARILEGSKSIAVMVGSYVLSRIVSFLQLEEPSSLATFGEDKFKERPELELITMGHTHHADQFAMDGKWFFNTGTWIPIIETSSANISHDRTFVFLHIVNKGTSLSCESLLRWNDDACRPEPLVLINKKE